MERNDYNLSNNVQYAKLDKNYQQLDDSQNSTNSYRSPRNNRNDQSMLDDVNNSTLSYDDTLSMGYAASNLSAAGSEYGHMQYNPNTGNSDDCGDSYVDNHVNWPESFNYNSNDEPYNAGVKNMELFKYIVNCMKFANKTDPKIVEVFRDMLQKNEFTQHDYGRTTPFTYSEVHAPVQLNQAGFIYYIAPKTINTPGAMFCKTDQLYLDMLSQYMENYPGPLSSNVLEDKVQLYLEQEVPLDLVDCDRDSAALLLKYLGLLIKSKGCVQVRDLVSMLNEGVDTRTAELRKTASSRIGTYPTPGAGGSGYYRGIGGGGADMGFMSGSRASYSRASSRASSRAASRPPSPDLQDDTQSVISLSGGDRRSSSSMMGEQNLGNEPRLPHNSLDFPPGPGSTTDSILQRAAIVVSSDQRVFSALDSFRRYVFLGQFEEAVNSAIRDQLWDHAFALSMRLNDKVLMDKILQQFLRKAILKNDPLFTAHELLAGKQPNVVLSFAFTKSEFACWRSHLSMMLSVKKLHPVECRAAIESLGDKLVQYRDYYAGHLCYLLAGTQFGQDPSAIAAATAASSSRGDRNNRHRHTRLELIGWVPPSPQKHQQGGNSDCNRISPFSAPELNIMLTEVLEYGLRLAGNGSEVALSAHLLPYKYSMVYRRLSRQQVGQAYEYCREIGRVLASLPRGAATGLQPTQIMGVRATSQQLHHSIGGASQETEDCHWLLAYDRLYEDICLKSRHCPAPHFANLAEMMDAIYRQRLANSHTMPAGGSGGRGLSGVVPTATTLSPQGAGDGMVTTSVGSTDPLISKPGHVAPPSQLPMQAMTNRPPYSIRNTTASSHDDAALASRGQQQQIHYNPRAEEPPSRSNFSHNQHPYNFTREDSSRCRFSPNQQPYNPTTKHRNEDQSRSNFSTNQQGHNPSSNPRGQDPSSNNLSPNQQGHNPSSNPRDQDPSSNNFSPNQQGHNPSSNPRGQDPYSNNFSPNQQGHNPSSNPRSQGPSSSNFSPPNQAYDPSSIQRYQDSSSSNFSQPNQAYNVNYNPNINQRNDPHPSRSNLQYAYQDFNHASNHQENMPHERSQFAPSNQTVNPTNNYHDNDTDSRGHFSPTNQMYNSNTAHDDVHRSPFSSPPIGTSVPGMSESAFRPQFMVPGRTEPSTGGQDDGRPVDTYSELFAVGSRSRTLSTNSHGSQQNEQQRHQRPVVSSSRSRTNSESTSARESSQQPVNTPTTGTLEATKEEQSSSDTRSQPAAPEQQQPQQSGWFPYSIFKRKNQVNLPSDENNKIYFDKERNVWVNEDEPEPTEEVKPPQLPLLSVAPGNLSGAAGCGPPKPRVSKYAAPSTVAKHIKPAENSASPPSFLLMQPQRIGQQEQQSHSVGQPQMQQYPGRGAPASQGYSNDQRHNVTGASTQPKTSP